MAKDFYSPASPLGERLEHLSVGKRFSLAFVFAVLWASFATIIALPWIGALGEAITLPGAVFVIGGLAIIPGYLSAFLLASIFIDKPKYISSSKAPRISVLIAAYNEEGHIQNTIAKILESKYPGTIDIIIADDGSKDRTAEKVLKSGAKNITLLRLPHRGKAAALNSALQHAKTEIVVTVDADTLLHPEALLRLVSRLDAGGEEMAAMAGALMTSNSRENALTRMQQWDYQLGIASIKRSQSIILSTLVAQGAFSAYRKKDILEAGGWKDMSGEDIVLTWGMLRNRRIGFEPTAIAWTRVPSDIQAFARQRSRWARGMIEGLKEHGGEIVGGRSLTSHGVFINYLFPWVDFTYTFAFIPGVLLAFTGNFMIVGPITLLVLPLNIIVFTLIHRLQKQNLKEVSCLPAPNKLGFFLYMLFYQALTAPISLWGYLPGGRKNSEKVVSYPIISRAAAPEGIIGQQFS